MMPIEPKTKRAIAFVDGQNLFNAAKRAFGYRFPNYDIPALAKSVCRRSGWALEGIYFYTGIPSEQVDPSRHRFWVNKLAVMGTRGITSFARELSYHNQIATTPDGTKTTALVGREKGVDVRLALDVVRLGREKAYDVAVIFSQDQDMIEVAKEVRAISISQQRWIKVASAFPVSPTYNNKRGIDKTDWVRIDRHEYDRCTDPNNYRE